MYIQYISNIIKENRIIRFIIYIEFKYSLLYTKQLCFVPNTQI